jgi:hypothetical protein
VRVCSVCEHDFYVKITPRRKSGNAVARASVTPVQLHRLICHKGINTRRIIARGGGSGGGGLITLGDDYATPMNLYISRFSDGVLFSYSTVYKKNGH